MINRLAALLLLVIFIIPIVLLIVIATLDTGSFGLFIQKRVGLHGKPFNIFKIRTLKGNYTSSVTSNEMQKSVIGNTIRYYHLDELPQLFNILIGDMDFVGPRPDTEEMYNLLTPGEFNELTSFRPGITGITQIENFHEEQEIASQIDPETYYKEQVWPKKVRNNIDYYSNRDNLSDLKIIFETIKKLFS